jgi:hypothetical protein
MAYREIEELNLGVNKSEIRNLPIDLVKVPYNGKYIVAAYPGFGQRMAGVNFGKSNHYNNLSHMESTYYHSKDLPEITFRGATISEAISIAAFDFRNLAKPKILDSSILYLGHAWLTMEEGIVLGIPDGVEYDERCKEAGERTMGEQSIRKENVKNFTEKCMKNSKEIGGAWIYDGDDAKNFAFVPYDSFKIGHQDARDFVRGGLAIALEHTHESVAKNLEIISDSSFYKEGVVVGDFREHSKGRLGDEIIIYSSRWEDADSDELTLLKVGLNEGNYLSENGWSYGVLNESTKVDE